MNRLVTGVGRAALAAGLIVLVASCDMFGSSDKKSGTTDTRANDALLAIPLATEVLGLSDFAGSSAGAFGVLAVADPTDDPTENELLLDNVDDYVNEYENNEVLFTFLRLIARSRTLVMNDVNRLSDMPTEGFPLETGIDWPATVDMGVLQVREIASNTVNIQWVVDLEGLPLLPDDDGDEEDGVVGPNRNYLDITLVGSLDDVATARIWMITNPQLEPSGGSWEWGYVEINASDKTVDSHSVGHSDLAPDRTRKQLYRRRATGKLDAMVSSFEDSEGDSVQKYVRTFRVAADYTVAYEMALPTAAGPGEFAPAQYATTGAAPDGSNTEPPQALLDLYPGWKALTPPTRPVLTEFPLLQ